MLEKKKGGLENKIAIAHLDELADVVIDSTTPHDGLDDAGEVVVHQDDVRRFFGDVCPGDAHGEPDVGHLERGGVVRAVPGHGDHFPVPSFVGLGHLHAPHQVVLVLRQAAR